MAEKYDSSLPMIIGHNYYESFLLRCCCQTDSNNEIKSSKTKNLFRFPPSTTCTQKHMTCIHSYNYLRRQSANINKAIKEDSCSL